MAKKNTVTKDAPATKVETPQVVTVANLAREMGKSPKAVRARFRKMYAGDKAHTLPQPVKGGSKWTFAAKDRDELAALIGTVENASE